MRELLARKKTTVILVSILLIGAFLRYLGLGFGLPDKDYIFSYSSDENKYLKVLSGMSVRNMDLNPHYFNWGTFHYYELGIMIAAAKASGLVRIDRSKEFYHAHPEEYAKLILAARLLSFFYGLAAIYLVFLIGKKVFEAQIGLLAAAFLSVCPVHIVHSIFLKADAAVTFWSLILLWFSLCIIMHGSKKYYYLAGISGGLALGTQWTALPLLHSIFSCSLLKNMRQISIKQCIGNLRDSSPVFTGYLAMLFTYALICPYSWISPGEFIQGIKNVLTGNGGAINHVVLSNYITDALYLVSIGITYPVLILLLCSIIYSFFRARDTRVCGILLWSFPLMFLIVARMFLIPRYYLVILPGYFLLISFFVQSMMERLKKTKIVLLAAQITLALILFYSFFYSLGMAVILKDNEKVQNEASYWMEKHIPAGSRVGILTSPEIRFVPTIVHNQFYYPKDDILNYGKPYFEIVSINDDPLSLERNQPDYFTLSNQQVFRFEFPRFMVQDKDSPEVRKKLESDYEVIKKFSFDLKVRMFGVELDYSCLRLSGLSEFLPTLYILKRKM